jgi:hypothetical protein
MRSWPARGGRASRRRSRPGAAAYGWEVPVVPTRAPAGWWSAAGAARDAGRKALTGKTACCFSARKRLPGRVSSGLLYLLTSMEQARTTSTRPNIISVCPGLTGLEHGQTAGSAPQGPGVTVTVESGGLPPTGPAPAVRPGS